MHLLRSRRPVACLQGGDTSNFGLQGDGGLDVQHPTLLGNLHVWLGLQPHAQERRHRSHAEDQQGQGQGSV